MLYFIPLIYIIYKWLSSYTKDGAVTPIFPIFYNLPVVFYHSLRGDYLEWLLSLSSFNYFTLQTPLKSTTRVLDGPSSSYILNNTKVYKISDERPIKGVELFGRGLLADSGKKWRLHRSKLTKLASTRLINLFMNGAASNVMRDMRYELDRRIVVNARTFVSKYVLRLLFFYFYDTDIIFSDKEITMFDDMVRYYKYRTYNPLWYLFFLLKLSYEKKVEEYTRDIKSLVTSVCDRVGEHDYDFILNLMVAGIDTTSRLISVYLYNGYKSENLDHGLQEAMRLFPPLPSITREAMCDDILPNGAKIRKGDHVAVFLFGQGRSARYWGSDYNEFKPSRWENKQTHTSTRAYFSMGPRVCPGSKFAIEEAKLIINNIETYYNIIPISEVRLDQMPLGIFCGDKLMIRFDKKS